MSDQQQGRLEAIEREMQIAHSLLSETRAKVTDGQPIWARFEWFKTVLVRERDEEGALRLAAEAELGALRHQLAASEHRRNAAENRADAMRMERDALMRVQRTTPEGSPR